MRGVGWGGVVGWWGGVRGWVGGGVGGGWVVRRTKIGQKRIGQKRVLPEVPVQIQHGNQTMQVQR